MDILNVEIWRAGETTDGRKITKKEVQEAYQNTYLLMLEGYDIPIKLGHADAGQTSKGWIKNLKLKGGSLYGDFMNLDNETYNNIIDKKLPHRSAEIWNKTFWNGKEYKNVLKAVALLGIDTPSLFLKPIEAYENNELYTAYNLSAITNTGGKEMPENNDKLIQENFELKNKLKELENKKFETFQAENAQLNATVEKYQKELLERESKLAEYQKQLETFEKEKQAEYFSKLDKDINKEIIKQGKLAPAHKDLLVDLFKSFGYDPEKHGKILEVFKKVKGTNLTDENVEDLGTPEVQNFSKFDEQLGNIGGE